MASEQLVDAVANGQTDEGVLFCYTGTGAPMATNKAAPPCAAMPKPLEVLAGGMMETHRLQNTSVTKNRQTLMLRQQV